MTINYQAVQGTLIGILILSTFVVAIAYAYKKRLLLSWGRLLSKEEIQSETEGYTDNPSLAKAVKTSLIGPTRQYSKASHDLLPPLMDHPDFDLNEDDGYFETGDDDVRYELVDDEDLSLLKTAEAVVADIQNIVNNIASSPANPEEVCSKISAVLIDMTYLTGTEYYDAINSFIAVTVKRDTDLELTRDEIEALWLAEAA